MSSSREFKGANFDGQNLSGRDFSESDLTGASFRKAILFKANFTNTILIGANFTGAQIGEAPYWDPTAAVFNGANLTDAVFDLTCLDDVSFVGSNLTRTSFHGCFIKSTAPRFSGAVLTDIGMDSQLLERIDSEASERDAIAKLHAAVEKAETRNDLGEYLDSLESLGLAYMESDLYEGMEGAESEFGLLAERCERDLGLDHPRTIRSGCLWAIAASFYGVASYGGQPSDAMRKYINSIVKSGSHITDRDSSLFFSALGLIVDCKRQEVEDELADADDSDVGPETLDLIDSIKAVIETVSEALRSEPSLSRLKRDEVMSLESDVAILQDLLNEIESG